MEESTAGNMSKRPNCLAPNSIVMIIISLGIVGLISSLGHHHIEDRINSGINLQGKEK